MQPSQPPKRQLLVQKRHTQLCTAHPFTQAQTPTLYNAYQSARQPKSATCRGASRPHVIHVPWTHMTQHPDLHLNLCHFCTAHGRESWYFTMCIKMWFTKLIAAINVIKKSISLQPYLSHKFALFTGAGLCGWVHMREFINMTGKNNINIKNVYVVELQSVSMCFLTGWLIKHREIIC